MNMLAEPREIMGMFEKLTEIHLSNLAPFLEQVGPYADVLIMGGDLEWLYGYLFDQPGRIHRNRLKRKRA